MSLSLHPYRKEIDCSTFNCSVQDLTEYLKVKIHRDVEQHICAAHHVFVNGKLAAYFTTSPFSMLRKLLPKSAKRRLPAYEDVPMWLLGRLAVHREFAGNGFGTAVAGIALKHNGTLCEKYGGVGAVVDVLNDQCFSRRVNFYRDRLQFKLIPGTQATYFLPLKTIQKLPGS